MPGGDMIGILAREQWRFQRMYVVWTAAIVATAVGFATFATLSAATQGALDQYSDHALLVDAPFNDLAVLTDLGVAVPEDVGDYGTPTTTDELTRAIDAANADGAGAFAHVESSVVLTSASKAHGAQASDWPWPTTVSAVWGQPDWNGILSAGTAPDPDGIVLPANTARDLGVGIGDAVQVGHTEEGADGRWRFVSDGELTVSGLAHDIELYGREGNAYASHEQLPLLRVAQTRGEPDGMQWPIQAHVGWQHPSSALDPFSFQWGAPSLRTFGSSATLPWLLAALFTVGGVVAAFTLGRAQAGSRVKWIATARALGARRSHLVGVGALEWGAVFAAGTLVGLGLGWGAAWLAHARHLAGFASPPPVELSTPLVAIGLLIALAAVLSAAVVGVPSLHALRVPPTAALKDTPAADTAHLSRTVRFWPVTAVFMVFWLATTWLYRSPFAGADLLASLCALASVVAGIAVLVESSRLLVKLTAIRLARSHRPSVIHASMTMTGHPQQVAALATIHALLITAISGVIISRQADTASFGWSAYVPWEQMPLTDRIQNAIVQAVPSPLSAPTILALLVAVQLLVLAIMASARRVAWNESSTSGALGLSGRSAALGDAMAWWIAQALGVCVGLLLGLVTVGAVWLSASTAPNGFVAGTGLSAATLLGVMPWRIVTAAAIACLSLALAAGAALLAGATLRPRISGTAAPQAEHVR